MGKINNLKKLSNSDMQDIKGGEMLFTDGVSDGCSGVDRDRYAHSFWYTLGWGFGKTLRDQVW